MASVFNALGLTLRDCGFVKFNLFFPPMAVGAHLATVAWNKSAFAAEAVARLPVPAEKVPFFVAAVMPLLAIVCAVVAIMGITVYAPTGYASHQNRIQKAPGNLTAQGLPGWLDRMQGAQYNTFEACICMVCSFFVAVNCKLPEILFAKMATLFLALRLAYPFFYAFDMDLLRTQAWFTGLYALAMISFGALFPEEVLPLIS
jgi:uncharacterized MAPEG superfamily protein